MVALREENWHADVPQSWWTEAGCVFSHANAQHREAKFALLMWIHVLKGREQVGPPEDQVNYLRALAHEVTSTPGNAYHFYIMLQVPGLAFSAQSYRCPRRRWWRCTP